MTVCLSSSLGNKFCESGDLGLSPAHFQGEEWSLVQSRCSVNALNGVDFMLLSSQCGDGVMELGRTGLQSVRYTSRQIGMLGLGLLRVL